MKKQSFIKILLIVLMSMIGARTFAHDIAISNSDGVTIYYNWANTEKTELAVTYYSSYYSGRYYYSGNVVIPESVVYEGNTYSVTSIYGDAFYGCSNLTSVTIPNSVTSIGGSAFSGCSSLASLDIPESVTTIGSSALSGTAWYNNQPDGLVYAGKVAYKYKGEMPANTNITIKEGTLGIGGYAFSGYTNLNSVVIPNSVKIINSNAFENCRGLTSIIIPNNTTFIGSKAFYGCSGLTSITIPYNVTSIGDDAFKDCSRLTTITSEITTPFNIGNISNYYTQTTLVVPKNTKTAYQATDGWKKFTNIVEVGEGGIVDRTFNADGFNYKISENNITSIISCSDKRAQFNSSVDAYPVTTAEYSAQTIHIS